MALPRPDGATDKRWFNFAFTLRDGRRVSTRGFGAVSLSERQRLASVLRAARPVVAR